MSPLCVAQEQLQKLCPCQVVTVLSFPQGVHAGRVPSVLRGDAARRQEGRSRGGEAGGASLAEWFALPGPAGEAGVVQGGAGRARATGGVWG